MVKLKKTHVREVVGNTLLQLFQTTEMDVINSWGISKLGATQVPRRVNGESYAMAALALQVDGFLFKGKVLIALDETTDFYRIYGEHDGSLQEYYSDIAVEELGTTLDTMIETGGLSLEEYQTKVWESFLRH